MYEHRTHRLLTRRAFLRRAAGHALVAVSMLCFGVGVGTVGYRAIAHLDWVDAFLNASMIASGMGPVDRLDTPSAKIFAACYALFSGFVFVGVVGIVLAPWVHRLFHWIHLEDE